MKLHKVTLYITSYSMNPTETLNCIRDIIILTYFMSVCVNSCVHYRIASFLSVCGCCYVHVQLSSTCQRTFM